MIAETREGLKTRTVRVVVTAMETKIELRFTQKPKRIGQLAHSASRISLARIARPRGCDVLANGLIISPVYRRERHLAEKSQFFNAGDPSSLRAGPAHQVNVRSYHPRHVSHTAPQTSKSISYLSSV